MTDYEEEFTAHIISVLTAPDDIGHPSRWCDYKARDVALDALKDWEDRTDDPIADADEAMSCWAAINGETP